MTDGPLKTTVEKMDQEREALTKLVNDFTRAFSNLENEMANLLHMVLFWERPGSYSRVAHAIYFSPEGFGQRQAIVNNALTEWLREHPISTYDYRSLWNRINERLNTIRRTRNLLAHGSVRQLIIRDGYYVRVVPPTFSPELDQLVARGSIPGKSVKEMEQMNGGVLAMIVCVENMARAIEYHEEAEPTWRETYDALEFHLNRLDSWFPDAQNPQVPQPQPQSSAE
jgi:hypothetical protein